MIMIKTLSLFLLLFTSLLNAEWSSITLKEHIGNASLITTAKLVKEVERKELDFGTEQIVLFEKIESIKGDINGSFYVKGSALEMCMPQMLFPNTSEQNYLLFLQQEENNTTLYGLVHGERSGLMIDANHSVGWIANREKIDAGDVVMTSLEKVREEIKKGFNID